MRGRADTGFGVMTEEELKLAVAAARKRGEKVVMTNGVFDILHAGTSPIWQMLANWVTV
ncbi:bifunctional protein HldE [includes: D-beta-D-heptose 7-phosphate kinase; D-beta-D-heptose 1-phosphate adenosyltransferase] [Escherichia coli]|uniref:Bifunctional protein HldE [includes: D-beta-D-heptose 7-phosphate kinase D-beta-D-heptose 1-phosphate adenosyltransferase] n=1 Tax=Escherichia coli TaxID=562 RepID=A0A376TS76_ECOLX|nr:bifunctional protein HldE [includes: D-beta-D-heptose 7-phosphate kinase; D-beta-D-heptose 1-phosphate adenosyltransferase] [Escherichia coli]